MSVRAYRRIPVVTGFARVSAPLVVDAGAALLTNEETHASLLESTPVGLCVSPHYQVAPVIDT